MSKKIHVFLDLDETLINSIEPDTVVLNEKLFEWFPIYENNNGPIIFKTFLRPHLKTFLDWVFDNCNVSVWSAGERNYVLDIIKAIMPKRPLKIILWREHCEQAQSVSLKNLAWLETKIDLEQFGYPILIDDLKQNCHGNEGHCFNIKKFLVTSDNADKDDALLKVIDMLKEINKVDDITYF